MRWTVHGERFLYESNWMSLALVDVEIPGYARFDHHVLRMPRPAAATVVTDPERGVLLLWRHRFITDTWGWEIPGGGVEDGEDIASAAAREVLEETGWQPGPLHRLASFAPGNGHSDLIFHVFHARGASHVGPPADSFESERVEWVPWDTIRAELLAGRVIDGLSMTGLLWLLAGLPPQST